MIAGLVWMVLGNAGVLLAALAVTRRIRTGHFSLDVCLFLLVRLAMCSAAVLVTGHLGMLRGPVLGMAGAGILAALLAGGMHREIDPRSLRAALRLVPPLLWAAAVVFLARLVFQAWYFAPHVGDAVCYHLPKVAEWVQAGAITRETGVDYRSPFPGGFELFEIWWTAFLHHDVLIEAAGIELWGMAFAAVHALARWAGLPVPGAFLSGLLFASAPVAVMQAVSCLNDLPVAAVFLTATALVARRASPLVIGMALGIGIGVKPTFGFGLPGLLVLAWLVRKDDRCAAPRPSLAAPSCLVAVALGAYWYTRNLVLYGNPIYPGGARGFILPNRKLVQQVGPSLESLKENLRRLIDSRIYDHLFGYSPTSEMIAAWGPVVFGIGLPALLIVLRSPGRLRLLAASLGVSLISVFSLVLSDMWFTRFVLFVPALLCISAAAVAPRIPGIPLLLGFLVCIQFLSTLATERNTVGEFRNMASQPWRTRAPDMIGGIPSGREPVACLQGGGLFIYLLYGPDFSRPVRYIRTWDAQEIVSQMKEQGVRVIYGSREATDILEGCVRSGLMRPLVGRFYALK